MRKVTDSQPSCLGCKYAAWRRTESGSLHPSGSGFCSFNYELPPLPSSMNWLTSPVRLGGYISRKTPLKNKCAYYLKEE